MSKPIARLLDIVLIILSLTGCVAPELDVPVTNTRSSQTSTTTQILSPSTQTAASVSTPSSIPTPTQIPKVRLPIRGLLIQFDRRGWDSMYWPGQVIHEFNQMDEVVGRLVKEEVASQLDQMVALGVNYLTIDVSSSNPRSQEGPYVPPVCYISPELGLQYPQPTVDELTNLVAYLDLIHSKGMKVAFRLVNNHHDEKYKALNEQWLGSILKAIKGHPALDLILFEGTTFLVDSDGDRVEESCGVRAEPQLFAGPEHPGRYYIEWALQYAHELGFPWRQLSAQAMEGHYFWWAQAPNPFMTDGHFWDPAITLKTIFDDLQVPDKERTYAISFYERRRCQGVEGIPCEDKSPHEWALETVEHLFDIIGRDNGARVVAVELGLSNPVEPEWTTEMALQSQVWIMQAYGIEGGSLWRWVAFTNAEELDPIWQTPVRKRGVKDDYTPVKDVLQDLYTQGQANDLSLTPEKAPPIFKSVEITADTIKNGESVVIRANLGETHLFVTADISELDPMRRSPILFRQVRDGIYEQTITLDNWNLTPNGSKKITVSAMDFWSNTAATVLNVTLNNPTPVLDSQPPNDDFTGKVVDAQKWSVDTSGGGSVSQDGQLIFQADEKQAYSSSNVISTWSFKGDFDVQVEYQLGQGWDAPKMEHIDGAFMGAVISGQEYFINRLRSQNEDKLFSWSTTNELNASKASPALDGKFRITRSGTTLTFLFDIGDGWKVMSSTTVPASPIQVRLGNGSIGAFMGFSTSFDNFSINNGVTTYKP